MKHKGELIVVSGFAGTGKGTVMKKLIAGYDEYVLSVSATTRQPRAGEIDGVHYFFKERECFLEMIEKDELLEYAEYVGNFYGTPKSFVEQKMAEGKDVILEIEIQGALKIKEKFPEAILLFLVPPSATELKSRLVGRGTETMDVIDKRLKRAVEESEGIDKYDYIVVNDDIDECVRNMHSIIQAAHYVPMRQKEFINELYTGLKEL